MAPRSRRWLPGLLVAAALVVAASAAGAQVDPGPPLAVWASSCVASGPSELVVYGRGWEAGTVTITVGTGEGSATAASGVFQARVAITAPAEGPLVLTAKQGAERTAQHTIDVSSSCSPSVSVVVGGLACLAPGQLVPVNLTVAGTGTRTFDHYVDLFGPAETINRSHPAPENGSYTLSMLVRNVPGRIVPVTVEATEAGGTFTYATTNATLPPECASPETTTSTAPPTTVAPTPETTAPPATPAPAAPAAPLPPAVAPPSFGLPSAPPSLSLGPSLGQAGQATTVAGTGFGPSTPVTLRWRPGIGEWTVTAGGDGSFRTQVLVLPNDIEGPRRLEAVGTATASASYLVVPGSQQPAFGGVFVRG